MKNSKSAIVTQLLPFIFLKLFQLVTITKSPNKFSVDLWTRSKNYCFQLKELQKMKGNKCVTIADFEFFM
jgi:hypothetical protein